MNLILHGPRSKHRGSIRKLHIASCEMDVRACWRWWEHAHTWMVSSTCGKKAFVQSDGFRLFSLKSVSLGAMRMVPLSAITHFQVQEYDSELAASASKFGLKAEHRSTNKYWVHEKYRRIVPVDSEWMATFPEGGLWRLPCKPPALDKDYPYTSWHSVY